MEPNELMKPRYKVIASWPDCPYLIGDVLTPDFEEPDKWVIAIMGLKSPIMDAHPNQWPHLFKELEWYKDRKKEDFPNPLYVMDNIDCKVHQALRLYGQMHGAFITEQFGVDFIYCTPITEQEYNDYIKPPTP